MRDFTLHIYKKLLESALENKYYLTSYEDYILNKRIGKIFILRHDVDRLPINAYSIAQMQHRMGVKGTYYFRIVKESFSPDIISKIAALGHEIGYHYEDLALQNGNLERAFDKFQEHLELLRRYYPVKTICMHGSPFSKWDNRLLWKKYDYHNLGIIGEPYFDIDFKKVLYITDTGRGWNFSEVSVRDRVDTSYLFKFDSTNDIITHFKNGLLPDIVMQNIHPHRWFDNSFMWLWELIFQNIKNIVKRQVLKVRSQYAN